MGICKSFGDKNKSSENNGIIRCIYDIKDTNNYVQIINNDDRGYINKEIELYIKILNGTKEEKLTFKKKFDKIGLNTIEFTIKRDITNINCIFNGCSTLKQVHFISFDTSRIKYMRVMFKQCNELEYLDLSKFNTSNTIDMGWMFEDCFKLRQIIGFNELNTINVRKMDGMFKGCSGLEYLDISNFNTVNATNLDRMFYECYNLKQIKGLNKFNTNNVTNLCAMFFNCPELEYLDLSSFNTINANDMSFMFKKCFKLKEIKGINTFNTINVTNMICMFSLCSELEFIDLSNFNTINVNNMSFMFQKCYKLKQIKGINNFNTNKVTKMTAMFEECYELEYLDLSKFDTRNVEEMGWMFAKCYKLKQIKGINSFNTARVKKIEKIFESCNELQNVDLNKFKTVSKGGQNENTFAVNFMSSDQKINFPLVCKNTDLFSELLERLYLEYPDLKRKNIVFIVNGNVIDKAETLDKNKIKSGNAIMIIDNEAND